MTGPVEDARAPIAEHERLTAPPADGCKHDWHNRVSGGSLCSKCNTWQDKRVTPPTDDEREALARRFHEAYERLAPSFGYKTREASAVPWEQVPEANRRLMIAVAGEVLADFHRQGPITDEGEDEPLARSIAQAAGAHEEVRFCNRCGQVSFDERANVCARCGWTPTRPAYQATLSACPNCGSTDTRPHENAATSELAFWRCDDCRHRWEPLEAARDAS